MDVLRELADREPIFHRPEPGTDVDSMVTDGFWEIGASGRVYDRAYTLTILDERTRNPPEEHWQASEFRCQRLAPDLYLLTYALLQGDRPTRRGTIWRHTGTGWKIVYHQGTVVQDDGPCHSSSETS
jgi:hypothetical protein